MVKPKQSTLKCKISLLVFLTVFVFTTSLFAQHYPPSMCGWFEDSEKIFVGTLIKQNKKAVKGTEKEFVAELSVRNVIKGLKPNENKIKVSSSWSDKYLKTGEVYLFFLIPEESGKGYKLGYLLPATLLYEKSNKSKKQKKDISEGAFHIAFGHIPTAAYPEGLKRFKIDILVNGKSYYPKLSSSGIYALVYPSTTKVTVSIDALSESAVGIFGNQNYKIESDERHTKVIYELNETTVCDSKEFHFIFRYK